MLPVQNSYHLIKCRGGPSRRQGSVSWKCQPQPDPEAKRGFRRFFEVGSQRRVPGTTMLPTGAKPTPASKSPQLICAPLPVWSYPSHQSWWWAKLPSTRWNPIREALDKTALVASQALNETDSRNKARTLSSSWWQGRHV